jgi:C_GCAxxG_C_C family probable redox protein
MKVPHEGPHGKDYFRIIQCGLGIWRILPAFGMCLKNRPVRGPGLHEIEIPAAFCRPRALPAGRRASRGALVGFSDRRLVFAWTVWEHKRRDFMLDNRFCPALRSFHGNDWTAKQTLYYLFGAKKPMRARSDVSVEKFLAGYNCAQAVLYSFCDDLGLDKNAALKLACGFGAGMARKQEVCGAITGGIITLGLKHGRGEGQDRTATEETYRKVRESQTMRGQSRIYWRQQSDTPSPKIIHNPPSAPDPFAIGNFSPSPESVSIRVHPWRGESRSSGRRLPW